MSAFNKFLEQHLPEIKGDVKQNAIALNGFAGSTSIRGAKPCDSLNALAEALTIRAGKKEVPNSVARAIADALEDYRGQCTSYNGRRHVGCKTSTQFVAGILAATVQQVRKASSIEEAAENVKAILGATTGLTHAEFKYMRDSDIGKDFAKSGVKNVKPAVVKRGAPIMAGRPVLAGVPG